GLDVMWNSPDKRPECGFQTVQRRYDAVHIGNRQPGGLGHLFPVFHKNFRLTFSLPTAGRRFTSAASKAGEHEQNRYDRGDIENRHGLRFLIALGRKSTHIIIAHPVKKAGRRKRLPHLQLSTASSSLVNQVGQALSPAGSIVL